MLHDTGREVLRGTCAFTLGDEPLASAVEHGASELRYVPSEIGIPFHHPVYCHVRKQPALGWQGSIQQALKDGVQRHLPLGSLGLQLPDVIGSYPGKPPQVPLAGDILSEESTSFPRAQPCE
jgi:hypothetical protein